MSRKGPVMYGTVHRHTAHVVLCEWTLLTRSGRRYMPGVQEQPAGRRGVAAAEQRLRSRQALAPLSRHSLSLSLLPSPDLAGGSVAAENVGAGHAAEVRFSQRNGPTARTLLRTAS